MKWINLAERQPKVVGDTYTAQWTSIYGILARSIKDKIPINNDMLLNRLLHPEKYSNLDQIEWLDESDSPETVVQEKSEDDLRTKIEALTVMEPHVEITMGTAHPFMRKKKYGRKGGYIDRDDVLKLLK